MLTENQINKINFLAIQQYLTGHNWEKTISKTGDKAFFRKVLGLNTIEIIPNSVTITKDYITPLERIVERIRKRDADEVGEFVGRISEIKADPDINSRNDGQITFNCIGDIGAIKAKATLESNDFQQAVKAFEDGKNVKITGILRNSGRAKIIENPSFEVIS